MSKFINKYKAQKLEELLSIDSTRQEETEDENEMRTIKKNFTEKIPTSDPNWFGKTTQYYDIILDYDEAGYVNKITIE